MPSATSRHENTHDRSAHEGQDHQGARYRAVPENLPDTRFVSRVHSGVDGDVDGNEPPEQGTNERPETDVDDPARELSAAHRTVTSRPDLP